MVLRGQNNELLPWPPKSPNQSSQCTGLTGPGHEGPKSQNRGVKYPIKASEASAEVTRNTDEENGGLKEAVLYIKRVGKR